MCASLRASDANLYFLLLLLINLWRFHSLLPSPLRLHTILCVCVCVSLRFNGQSILCVNAIRVFSLENKFFFCVCDKLRREILLEVLQHRTGGEARIFFVFFLSRDDTNVSYAVCTMEQIADTKGRERELRNAIKEHKLKFGLQSNWSMPAAE